MATSVFGLRPGQLTQALDAACRAPSLLNTQPWAFLVADERIEVFLDTRWLLPAADPERRQATIACAGAVLNLRLSLADRGVEVAVEVWPDGSTGPLARMTRSGPAQPSRRRTELDRAIAHRHTNRRPFFSAPVPVNFQQVLSNAAHAEGAVLHLITDAGRLDRVRRWTADAHRMRLEDPAWTSEQSRWLAELDPVERAARSRDPGTARWAPKVSGHRGGVEDDGGDSGEHPLIGVLTTDSDSPTDWVRAGQALEHTLLAATGLGLSMSTLPEMIEEPLVRRRLKRLLETDEMPQAVVRLGFDGPVRRSRRRPLADCLITSPPTLVER